jgi:hypothetical protein
LFVLRVQIGFSMRMFCLVLKGEVDTRVIGFTSMRVGVTVTVTRHGHGVFILATHPDGK